MTDTTEMIEKAYAMIQITPEESVKIFDELLKNDKNNINLINGKASAYMKLDMIDEADKLLDKSIEIKTTSQALINKGLINKNKKEYECALKYYNMATNLNPQIKKITSILKNEIFDLIGDDLNLFSKEVNLLVSKGLSYKKENKYWDSLECYELAIQKDENCLEYIDSLIDEINIIIENQFLFSRPPYDNSAVSQNRIMGLQKLLLEAKPNEALTYFNKVLKSNPDDIDTLNYKAIVMFNQNNYTQAIQYFDKCLSIDENYYYALFNKSIVLIRIRRIKEALECFEQLHDNPQSYNIAKKYNIEDIKKINQNKK